MVSVIRRLILFTLGFTVTAHAALEVKTDKTQSQLGEAIVLQIKSAEDLSAMDLSPLTKNFALASQTLNRAESQGRDEYMLEATLYPLRSGVVTIPSLTLGTQRSRALGIRVEPGNVSMRSWFPPGTPMARQATTLHLEIRDDGSFNWDTPIQIDAPYTIARALPETIREEVQDGIKNKVHHFRWQILPLREGSVTVNFGMLDAHRFAQRLRFPAGHVSLNVRAAPAYLPLSLPIGQPVIRSDPHPKQVIANKLQAWNMDIHAPGLTAEGLKSLLQFSASDGVFFYPPSVASVTVDDDEYLRVTLSYKTDRSARVFPAIHLPYFDVRTQRIEAVTLPASPLDVQDPALQRLLAWVATILGLCLLMLVSWLSWTYWRRRDTKEKWLAQINAAQTPAELYTLLTSHAPWRARTPRHLPAALHVDASQFAELDSLRFGRMDRSRFPTLKANLVHLVAKTSITLYPQHFLHR